MKLFVLYIGMIVILASGCRTINRENQTSHKELHIDLVDSDQVSPDAIFKDFTFIQLETNDRSLLDNVQRVIHFDHKLFILTPPGRDNRVCVFKETGEFMFKIERGRGPSETIFPSDIVIDRKNNQLIVLDRYRIIKYFDFEGQYIKSTTLDDEILYLEMLGDKIIAFDSDLNKKTDYYSSLLNGKTVEKRFIPKVISDIRKGPFLYPYPFFKISADSLLVSCYLSDTVYCVHNEGKNIFPYCVVDYGGRSANAPDRLKRMKDIFEYGQTCNSQNYGSGFNNIIKADNKLFFSFKASQSYFVVHDFVQNTTRLHTKLFEGLPNMYTPAGYDQGQVIFSFTTPWLMDYFSEHEPSETDSESVKQLRAACTNEDDNPVLLFCKLK